MMEYQEIITEKATPVSVVGKTSEKPVATKLPAYLQTAHRYAPALGCATGKTSGHARTGAKASVVEGGRK